MATIVAGIDVSKTVLDVHVNGIDRRFDNNGTGFRPLGKAGISRTGCHGLYELVAPETAITSIRCRFPAP